MFFVNKKSNVLKICFHILFSYFFSYETVIPSESYYNVGRLLECDVLDDFVETVSIQDIHDVLDEIYYLELYIEKLKDIKL